MSDLVQMLSMIPGPAFTVKEGKVLSCNASALQLIQPGTDISSLTQEDLTLPKDGSLYVGLTVAGVRWGAAVTELSDQLLFSLEPMGITTELKAMTLLGNQIRMPLAGLSLLAGNQGSCEMQHEIARILRIVNNISLVERFVMADGSDRQVRELCGATNEVFEECSTLLQETGILLRTTVPQAEVLTVLNWDMIRHAIYAMVSNAAKHSATGAMIEAELALTGSLARISITDHGSGIPDEIRGSLFSRYTRQPGIEDGLQNLGLGMTLIRTAALSHGGTVLVEKLNTKGTRVTMTLTLCVDSTPPLRSSRTIFVPSTDDALVMLSDVLPAKLYK